MSEKTYPALRRSEQLLRRARLRRALNTHTGKDGFSTVQQIAEHLGEGSALISSDLASIGAVKIRDTIDGTSYTWWIIPSHNPLLPDLRDHIGESALLNELSLKIRAHVLEIFTYGTEIIVKTERSAGPLLADWLSLLPWPEILHVSEERSSALVKCTSEEAAEDVLGRILGEESDA